MKIRFTVAALALLSCIGAGAQTMEYWQDPAVFEKGRMPMSATFQTDQQQTISLNKVWKFNFCPTIEGRLKGFEAVGFDDSAWAGMPVPGMLELNGYGDPVYLNVGYAWRGHYENNPPFPCLEHNYVGQYRTSFALDSSWSGKQICLSIGSATSNVRVWVNGKEVGYSQDSKLECRFDITKYVKVPSAGKPAAENIVALEIFRWCDGTYLEDQDFWRFTGIARGVSVISREQKRIEDVHVLAGMDGKLDVAAEVTPGVSLVEFEVEDASGKTVASFNAPVAKKYEVSDNGNVIVKAYATVASPSLWSAEIPDMYTLKVVAKDRKGICESTAVPFGFRTVEIKNSQLLVNGQPILIKGADRHELVPAGGYVVTEEEMIADIRIMKQLNMNAVRTCHYPDDPRWLALCDKYGLYVVDEGNIESHGMGYAEKTLAKDPAFLQAHLSRDQRMVKRDFNHPCVIVWSMGNEAGDGPNFQECYKWIKAYDPSRPVQYERAGLEWNTDIYCPMYATVERCEKFASGNPDRPLIQCEYAHAMGNSMGNFKEYWDLIRKYPSYQGGFIWDFQDQALWKDVDEPGTDHIYAFGGDYNDYDPSDGSFNCNGVIAADRSLHPHAYEARYQHRNIHTSAADLAKGTVKVYNENFFRSLDNERMEWNVTVNGEKVLSGVIPSVNIAARKTVSVSLGTELSQFVNCGKDAYLNVSWKLVKADGLLSAGEEVAYDQICLCEAKPEAVLAKPFVAPACKVSFDANGFLSSYTIDGREMLKAPLMPCFDRALTENDLGANFQNKMSMWRGLQLKLASSKIEDKEGFVRYIFEYEPVGGIAPLRMTYDVYPDGTICGTESMTDGGKLSQAQNLFRFGMRMAMPGRYSSLDFYGKGPWENYQDRESAAVVGRYLQSVNEQYHYGYVRTQESGTHTSLAWFRVADEAGTGIQITSDERFSASALPFSLEDLDVAYMKDSKEKGHNHQYGAPQHSLSLKAKAHENDRANGTTYVHFDLTQMGVGGTNSWGRAPLDQYMVRPEAREFHFVIKPMKK